MSAQGLRLPDATRERLEQFRRRVRFVKLAEGVLAGCLGLVLSYLVVFTVDRLIDTPAAARAGVLLIGSLGWAVYFPLKCHRWVWGTRRMEQVAILLKHRFPALGDQLLGIVELAQSERDLGASARLAQAAIEQVDAVVRERDFSAAVPYPRHRRWAMIVAVPSMLVMAALLVVPAAAWNALARWLTPWRDTPRYTFAQVNHLPNRLVVPHGEPFSLAVTLSDATRWSPSAATARFAGQPAVTTPKQQQSYSFQLPPQTASGVLNLRVGDLTRAMEVQVANRPELVSLAATITLPDYLQYPCPVTADVRGGMVSVLKGSVARLEAEVSRELSEAWVKNQSATVHGSRVLSPPVTVVASDVVDLRWRDQLGLASRDAFQLKIQAVDDAPPEISLTQQEPQQVVLSTDVITLELQSRDDFGLKSVGLAWQGIAHPVDNPAPDQGDKLVAGGSPQQTRIAARATFCAASDHLRAQTIELRAYAEDYEPARGRVYSTPYILHVMTPQQHAVWMMDQLRQTEPDRLNHPEVRRQIEQQAAAERANGQRLGAVTDQGDQLIQQAMRNPEMLVGHLETWADSLQRLRQIAEHRMPSVADLLRQGAQAPGNKPSTSVQASAKGGPQAGRDLGQSSGGPGQPKKSDPSQSAVPQLVDVESGFNKLTPPSGPPGEQPPSPAGQGKFGLAQTTLQGGAPPKKSPPEDSPPKPAPPSNPAAEKLDDAVQQQTDLLAEFQKVQDDLQKIMDDLENSTFVKRFKAASRTQLELASALNRTLFDAFGVSDQQLGDRQKEQSDRIAVREEAQGEQVGNIQSDLEAYYDRRKEEKLLRIVKEMKEVDVITRLRDLGGRIRGNRSGDSIARAEFWADTLDRWAEELVSASALNTGQ